MDMNKKINALEKRWGPFTAVNHWREQLPLPFVTPNTKLNLLFDPVDVNLFDAAFFGAVGMHVPSQLGEFYQVTNGCRLFSDSLCIYGLQKRAIDVLEPYDVLTETNKANIKLAKLGAKYILIGSLGGQYWLAYSMETQEKIIVLNADNGKKVKEYQDFDQCFDTLFNNLMKEYDDVGRKIHVNKKYRDVPVLSNLSFEKTLLL